MINYLTDTGEVSADQISGFFVGWPNPPSAETLITVMDSSYRRVWAVDGETVVGYINAISDGVLTAFLPWLEVHPEYQGRGIGSEPVRRIMAQLDDMYSVDLACDEHLVGFYERLGLKRMTGMYVRNYAALAR